MASGSWPVGVGPGKPTLASGGNSTELTVARRRSSQSVPQLCDLKTGGGNAGEIARHWAIAAI